MNILVTGGRSPYTLELIRLFGKAGHRVVAVEFFSFHLSQYSKYVSQNFRISSPNMNFEKFEDELMNILKSQKIDIVIPTCEEIFHLAKIKRKIEAYSTLFAEDFGILKELHSKHKFIEMLKRKNLLYPKSFIWSEYKNELSKKKIILKKNYSRFASNIHILNEAELGSLKIENKEEWLIQEFIEGKEASLYVVLIKGHICAYSCYLKDYSIGGGATLLFKHFEHENILRWIQDFFKGSTLTGHFSFDTILDRDMNVYPIECNPRGTSGIHLFHDQIDFINCFFNKTSTMTPKSSTQSMLGLAMLIYGLSLKNLKSWSKDFASAKDVIYSYDDLKPFFTQFITFTYFVMLAILKRKKVIEVTTLDIEYNG